MRQKDRYLLDKGIGLQLASLKCSRTDNEMLKDGGRNTCTRKLNFTS